MSLRLRLSLILSSAFVLLWALAATWMLFDLHKKLMTSLDQRLAASANMVAGLLIQLPEMPQDENGVRHLSAERLGLEDGLTCQVSSLRGDVLVRSHSSPQSALDAKQKGFHNQVIEGTRWRSFTLIRGDLRITTADKIDERITLKRSVLIAAALPVLFALIGSLIVLWIGIGKGFAPLTRIRQALAARNADSVEPLHVSNLPQELKPLVEAQNQLFSRIARLLERERRLTDDAAHELRSPLTAIKTHLQVAGMTEGDVSRNALAQAEIGADRMQQIIEQLLMLARVEGCVSFDDGLQCSASEIARLAISDAGLRVDEDIQLIEAEQLSTHPVSVPASLAVAAIRNLLENARRHTRPGTCVSLCLQPVSTGKVSFAVRDHGQGVAPEQMERLTERFWRDSSAEGSGLGLSIVKAIADRYGCELLFRSRTDGMDVELIIDLQPAEPS